MKLLIAKTPYLSNALFYYGLETNPETLANLDFITLIPSELASAAAGEKVDAGPIPLAPPVTKTVFPLLESVTLHSLFWFGGENQAYILSTKPKRV